MDSLIKQLYFYKSIPYISKKMINDCLTELVMKSIEPSFYSKIYKCVTDNVPDRSKVVVKGGTAIRAVACCNDFGSSDLDLLIYTNAFEKFEGGDDENDRVKSALGLNTVRDCIDRAAAAYRDDVSASLRDVKIENLQMPASTTNSNRLIVFKSYENEALVVHDQRHVRFQLNESMPRLKMTMSMLNRNDESGYLVRFSFNVLMTCSDSTMHLCSRSKEKRIVKHFPLDLYFLDVIIVPFGSVQGRRRAMWKDYMYVTMNCGGGDVVDMIVDAPEIIVCDQLECLFYNVFYFNENKIQVCARRIAQLIDMFRDRIMVETPTQASRAQTILSSSDKFSAQRLKRILIETGPLMGVKVLARLYFERRFVHDVTDITYQVNFPYHIWDKNYFSKCWKRYLSLLNDLFKLNLCLK
ncbi:hypothetical protein SlsnVgp109 [Spodoptera littoralis nucleopolyhedrovirus]|uniref:Uncharacterized protein n=1 Tax=Spodoptera littoralis nuclear polyhedrosis virus TaxID=10456 RepID=M1J4D4_NPVSL|nr:hypothetical protein SlsnVgp109 [Spodoptera littoralis nucleopolyhedrovirus]AGE89964.1 hypothetical protein SlsnVgp109 [Spodoptera littoralis nucleopolyhedrovirus]AYU75297.1 hypothetical protein [Spodoptera littoralis nucleopolyhedrovirus]